MTSDELKAIRADLALGVVDFGKALGYTGGDKSITVAIRRFECGMREIPPSIDRLARMYSRFGIPKGWIDGKLGKVKV